MKTVVIYLIWLYQAISEAFHRIMGIPPGRGCRFNPTCSEYMKLMVKEKGVVKGVALGLKQLSRCHPWHKKS